MKSTLNVIHTMDGGWRMLWGLGTPKDACTLMLGALVKSKTNWKPS